jgi:DnaK suppressor protein
LPGLAEVTMKKKEIEKFKKMLLERKNAIIQSAETARESAMAVEQADLPDEVDMATSETGQALNLRLRDRELVLLKKIDKTIAKMDEGEFGICERCGEDISAKRLEARPVAQLCIRCKEELEKVEKGFAE